MAELIRYLRGMRTSTSGPDFVVSISASTEQLHLVMKKFLEEKWITQNAYWIKKKSSQGNDFLSIIYTVLWPQTLIFDYPALYSENCFHLKNW